MTHAGRAASSPEIFRPFLTVCLTVFPFKFRPRTFTIGFYGKKSFISELMILECSFPLKAEAQPRLLSEDFPQLKPRAKNLMYLYCLTQENYPGLPKKTKDKLPLAKSKTARSTARPPLLGWRCALVRMLVFSFHLLSSSRRWLRWIDSGFLSEGFSVQARSVADPLLQCSYFSFSSEDLEKFEVFPQSGGRRV